MNQTDDLLREACAELAQEEADKLESSLSRTAVREAEDAYRHHRPKALQVIRRHTAKPSHTLSVLLPVAAALVITLGGVLLSMKQRPSDSVEQTQIPSEVLVQPYYTDSAPVQPPTTFIPSSSPTVFISPTPSPIIAATTTLFPTFTPLSTSTPMQTPTIAPTESPAPTSTPTNSPIPTLSPMPASITPAGWQGEHFPALLPPGFELLSVTREDDCCTAAYSRYGQTLIFTEYDAARLIEAPANAAYTYIQINGETALQVTSDDGVTLTWNQDGHTLSLFTPQGDGTDVAESVKKISAE